MVQGAGMRVLGFGLRVYKAGGEGLVAALLELLVEEEGERACCRVDSAPERIWYI